MASRLPLAAPAPALDLTAADRLLPLLAIALVMVVVLLLSRRLSPPAITRSAQVLAVSVLLGLRHASDPDHLAAVTTMIASGKERAARRAARLGFTWGLGHATSLFVFGLPVILYSAYLPAAVQRAAETSVGFVIVLLSLLLLVRWRRGAYHHRANNHAGRRCQWRTTPGGQRLCRQILGPL